MLTTPTVATVGLSLTIPLAFVSDLIVKGKVPDLWACGGAMFVVAGFSLVNVGSKEFEQRRCWGGRAGQPGPDVGRRRRGSDSDEEGTGGAIN